MKRILGLDLGTNSIGWGLVEHDWKSQKGKIIGSGVRIIPMAQNIMDDFGKGVTISQTADRTHYRGVRRLYERKKLRRQRLHRILHILGWLPKHYEEPIDFEKKLGQFKYEVKLPYKIDSDNNYHFLFQKSYNEMLNLFRNKSHTENVPYDWTLYYLRDKALHQKIDKEELAWIILNFNAKRGYYQLRGEDLEKEDNKQFIELYVEKVEATEEKVEGKTLYKIFFDNGWEYNKMTTKPENWLNKEFSFIVTEKTLKSGDLKRTYKKVDPESDWIAIKKSTEKKLEKNGGLVGSFIFDSLLNNPKQKVRGDLISTIERKYYKDELIKILEKQAKFHNEFSNNSILTKCVQELYRKNKSKREQLIKGDLSTLLIEDIIFYQRPLKSKKSTISNCPFESRHYMKNGEKIEVPIKATPKSNPYYQEFRIWQFLNNLELYELDTELNGQIVPRARITNELLNTEDDFENLFQFLDNRESVSQNDIVNYFIKKKIIPKSKKNSIVWNFQEDKKYPCNETKYLVAKRLKLIEGLNLHEILSDNFLYSLWHIIYSVKDKIQFEKALHTFAEKHVESFKTEFIDVFKDTSPFKSEYGAYSEKAIKKFLSVMRLGNRWDSSKIDDNIKNRIDKISTAEFDESIQDIVREKSKDINSIEDCKFLPTWLASFIIYNKFSELETGNLWKTPEAIESFLDEFKQHSLRNPIVEQVVTECLRVVSDIWEFYGKGQPDYFDEIHVEIGRDLKNSKDKRKRISEIYAQNEKKNQRIISLLSELSTSNGNVRDYSPSHQEILKIYEEGIINNPKVEYNSTDEKEISKIQKSLNPTKKQVKHYKAWLEQGYVSPYTGQIIGLSELFSTNYEIEHIIPKSRYFDNSMQNKVISETAVNQLKGNDTAYKFIENHGGSTISVGNRKVKIFTKDQYEAHCLEFYKNNRVKLRNLMSEEPPESFINRQLNDSRYISKFMKNLLSNIVRDEDEKSVTSRNLLAMPGALTSHLKHNWGLNDKWNRLVEHRFKRLNQIHDTTDFGYFDKSINAFRIQVPDELKVGFNSKRIDHRHHALDALVLACVDRRHIQYVSNLNQKKENYALREVLMQKNIQGDFTQNFKLPWKSYPVYVFESLSQIIISFKKNLRIINRTNNFYEKYVKDNGTWKKQIVKQKGKNFAIRKPLHKETVSGRVYLQRDNVVSLKKAAKDPHLIINSEIRNAIQNIIKNCNGDEKRINKALKNGLILDDNQVVKQVELYVEATASRVSLSEISKEKDIKSITDTGIQKILLNHTNNYLNDNGKIDYKEAFSPHGIDALNENIVELNNGSFHQPIYKVRKYEVSNKFSLGEVGNKSSKYVEAAKGTNLFFAIYWDRNKETRNFETIPLNDVIAHQKKNKNIPVSEKKDFPINDKLGEFLFCLSPNDLVYVPTTEEMKNPELVDFNNLTYDQCMRIYKMVSSTGKQCFFVMSNVSTVIISKKEFSNLNKMERDINDAMIKNVCWKLNIQRIGIIDKVEYGFKV